MKHQFPAITRLGLGGVALLLVLAGSALPAVASPAGTAPATAPGTAQPTVEEQRLDRAVPQEILRRSGFDALAPRFAHALEGARGYAQAERAVNRHGSALWQRAVDRAQGRGPVTGDLSRGDDRPLYWARLALSRELRAWTPRFALDDQRRKALHTALETSSRGQQDIRRHPGRQVKRVLVTGFDPFTLDRDVRIGNPSGASALALDGTLVRTAEGPARIEAVVFPVRWTDFAEGAVERALARHLPHLDLFTTISQGRQGRFDVERTNGAWRGGFPDNEILARTGPVPVTDPASQPQWTSTTLPYRQLAEAETGRFPVYDNTEVTEIPAGATQPVTRPDGPTPGSTARAGGGGDYLSNEIAYRATLLRDRMGLPKLPGGHLHTPVLQFGTGNENPATGEVTDPGFERNRSDIVRQVRALVQTAVSAAR
ncbi:pyroglutamyl peptidase [Streptomyces cyaneofuscatus]|uniref:Pyroglutamyl peptidase n=1 Tax=Streptomyces cyaneofuscatus TaxID=66883 RepID=A0ABZ1EQ77_9ACTN|nr:pyroglutamyl peptidase [Streptomyces cyaneofuscatus]WSB06243.1 pyroglutamyl peptidase [Streptomyces cyaneofuscatus]WSD50223.1 pyroglutamyl peptidase [Streptomyces cyaneofuscatus]WTA93720.1 pyroglutamyl peptidase [Streptomyces cyaneofuscatus]